MPLYKIITVNSSTRILIWKITESYGELSDTVVLTESSVMRLNTMKSEIHRRAFLSVRKLLKQADYTDFDLYYDIWGKPHLRDGKQISITHSHQFSAIILSDEVVGIDIELQRDKIIRIADKFVDSEFSFLEKEKNQVYIRKLTVIWGAKESIFKIRNEQGISFKDNINVQSFDLNDFQTQATLYFNNLIMNYTICFEEITLDGAENLPDEQSKQNFTLIYALEEK